MVSEHHHEEELMMMMIASSPSRISHLLLISFPPRRRCNATRSLVFDSPALTFCSSVILSAHSQSIFHFELSLDSHSSHILLSPSPLGSLSQSPLFFLSSLLPFFSSPLLFLPSLSDVDFVLASAMESDVSSEKSRATDNAKDRGGSSRLPMRLRVALAWWCDLTCTQCSID